MIIDIHGFLVAGSLITMSTLGDRIGRRPESIWTWEPDGAAPGDAAADGFLNATTVSHDERVRARDIPA